ncbi:23S rRNA (uracil(1939)-C(5))-methyltransferase [hydrothermal vent metagenome]|uniref:23S rRNA (Uracil(1939)-C(5))-methyltransferase n=1 Tax=hydrothermal vent metagenome TaxID=652676 RepID=A0A3B0YVG0_9ZZZZ
MSKRRRKPKLPNYPVRVTIESMTHDGRGVAHVEGKAVFVDGALPGEELSFMYTARSRKHDEGRLCELFQASDQRVEPKCEYFEICGGCSLQHQSPEGQILGKQQILLDNLERIGKVRPERVLASLTAPVWGYRNKARLGVKYVRKKGRVLVGFREKRKPFLADIRQCEVLHPSVGLRLDELAKMIQGMEARERIAQIEVAVGEKTTTLVFRNLDPLSDGDTQILKDYAQQSGLHIWLQPGGPDTVAPLWPQDSQLSYHLQDHDIEMQFQPTDFTQVNVEINRSMILQALDLLEIDSDSRVLDLFCGLGNFTLPLARRAAHVTGVEGDVGLVQRARENATRNGINNVEYHAVDLTQDPAGQSWMQQKYDRILLDPPRSGAQEMMPYIAALGAERIIYVSCHPGSLARDADQLVNEHGYRLVAAGAMDMFPHTAHVESMALFEKTNA